MMKNFRIELTELLKSSDHPRPFVCDGNPMDCKIFIVGINAATKMTEDCWAFWSDETDFNKTAWFENYLQHRQKEPLKEGKTRRNKISNTRQRVEWLVKTLRPVKTMETNLFVRPTATAKELQPEDKQLQVFKYLVQNIHPHILFIHGKEVKEHIEKLSGHVLTSDEFHEVDLLGVTMKVICMSHLSRGWSKKKTEEVGEWIKERMEGMEY